MFFLLWWAHCFYFPLQTPSHAMWPLMKSMCLWQGRRSGLDQSFVCISAQSNDGCRALPLPVPGQQGFFFFWVAHSALQGTPAKESPCFRNQHWIFDYTHRNTKHTWKDETRPFFEPKPLIQTHWMVRNLRYLIQNIPTGSGLIPSPLTLFWWNIMGFSGASLICIGMKHQDNLSNVFGPAKHSNTTSQPVSLETLEITDLEMKRWLCFSYICIPSHNIHTNWFL